MLRFFIMIPMLSSCVVLANQYVYPVAYFADHEGEHLLVIVQRDIDLLELCDINPSTNRTEKILSTMFVPAGIQMLPSKTGFSFVDNGRIKVKQFVKRSPKAVDFFDPLYGVELIHWLDDFTGYFHALCDNRSHIYWFNCDGDLTCIASSDTCDYQYPCIIDDQLWFIGKTIQSEHQHFFIGKATYHAQYPATDCSHIIDFETTPIIMLNMDTATRGSCIAYSPSCDIQEQIVKFQYYELKQEHNIWGKRLLFSFDIPSWMLFDQDLRLYESLLPLRPRQRDDDVFFCSFAREYGTLALYRYNQTTSNVSMVAHSNTNLLVPIFQGNSIWLGYQIGNSSENLLIVHEFMNCDIRLITDRDKYLSHEVV